uniref:Uncharacterized protein n=1 Tax=Anguilla anguilla TaxID=7936 RepID=A0A0E9PRE9_ANGAN
MRKKGKHCFGYSTLRLINCLIMISL